METADKRTLMSFGARNPSIVILNYPIAKFHAMLGSI